MTAERIRAYRRGRNLTQQEFGDLLGVKATAVAMWEGGQEPSGAALKLLEFLIEGKHPFKGKSAAPVPIPWDVELTLDEFEELGRRARRAGFETTRDYIAHLTKKSLRDKSQSQPHASPASTAAATQTPTRKRGAAGKKVK